MIRKKVSIREYFLVVKIFHDNKCYYNLIAFLKNQKVKNEPKMLSLSFFSVFTFTTEIYISGVQDIGD